MDKLNIKNEMRQLDRKNRDFYDSLTDEERRKFSNFLMIRWSSSVRADRELQEYYVRSCNHYLNRHFFSINRHPKLQWLCATAVSPGVGDLDHQWIAPKKKTGPDNEIKKTLMGIFPTMKPCDIDTLAALVTKQELKHYMTERGHTKD